MTKSAWLSSSSPEGMLKFLQEHGFSNERKLRLFAVACCRRIWHLLPGETRPAIEVSERFADGQATDTELAAGSARVVSVVVAIAQAWLANDQNPRPFAAVAAKLCISPAMGTAASQTALTTAREAGAYATRSLQGSDFSKIKDATHSRELATQARLVRDIFHNPFRPIALDPSWRTETVRSLAQSMYDSRNFSVMPILADALMDAGCNDPETLEHCRRGGPHVRGCWLVDSLLDKA